MNKEQLNEHLRNRYNTDPIYRERIKATNKRSRIKNAEKIKDKKRERDRRSARIKGNFRKFCACGCGKLTWHFDGNKKIQYWVQGHNNCGRHFFKGGYKPVFKETEYNIRHFSRCFRWLYNQQIRRTTGIKLCKKCKGSNWIIECGCGCGNPMPKYDGRYRLTKYLYRHQGLKGERNHNWKGGTRRISGYIMKYAPDHHFANEKSVMEHRLVWEAANNAILLPWGEIHHINHKRDDNRLENLKAMTRREHRRLSRPLDSLINMNDRVCYKCGKNNNQIKPSRKWGKNPYNKTDINWYCGICVSSIIVQHKKRYLSGYCKVTNDWTSLHRAVYQDYHKCCLLPRIHIHHIDYNIYNNSPKNLMAMTSAQHAALRRGKPAVKLTDGDRARGQIIRWQTKVHKRIISLTPKPHLLQQNLSIIPKISQLKLTVFE